MAVDESDTSRHALQQAVELAGRLSAALRMIHVVDMNWLPIGPEVAIISGTLLPSCWFLDSRGSEQTKRGRGPVLYCVVESAQPSTSAQMFLAQAWLNLKLSSSPLVVAPPPGWLT